MDADEMGIFKSLCCESVYFAGVEKITNNIVCVCVQCMLCG